MAVIYESGTISEIGDGEGDLKSTRWSHIVLTDKNGKSIRLNNVSAQASVVPRIRIGASGCLAFVNSGLLKRQNQILGFAEDGGYVIQTAAPIHYFLPWAAAVALGIAVTVTRSFIVAAIATLFPAYIFYKLFELHGVLAGVRRKFGSLGVSDNTAKVY